MTVEKSSLSKNLKKVLKLFLIHRNTNEIKEVKDKLKIKLRQQKIGEFPVTLCLVVFENWTDFK